MIVQTIKNITICLLLSIVSAFLFYLLVSYNGSLELWLIFLLGFLLSVIHIIAEKSENSFVRFSKLTMPLVTLFIVFYMVYVEFNYPPAAEFVGLSRFERGMTYISQLDKETIMNFAFRFFQIVSLKFLIGLYAFYALGSFLVKYLKFEGYTQQLFSEKSTEDGSLVKKHLKRKSTKFKRRF